MKLHLSMRVGDLDQAIGFYSALFGQKPVVLRENYAKWDVADPSVNFVIEGGHDETGFDHIGIEADDRGELETLADRMRGAGRPFLDVEATTCCYAEMEKAWIKGDAGENWEAFLTHSHDAEEYGTDRVGALEAMARGLPTDAAEPCCGPGAQVQKACC